MALRSVFICGVRFTWVADGKRRGVELNDPVHISPIALCPYPSFKIRFTDVVTTLAVPEQVVVKWGVK